VFPLSSNTPRLRKGELRFVFSFDEFFFCGSPLQRLEVVLLDRLEGAPEVVCRDLAAQDDAGDT
jgi:hypothetical protein